jgi:hypothetical protein
MSSSAAFVWSEWRVFLDGVEVPHQGFEVSFPTDQVSRAFIQLEPDVRLSRIRPNTMVHIFARDRFPSGGLSEEDASKDLGAKDKEELFLYWEGQSEGITYSKSASTRTMSLKAVGVLGVLETTKAFMMGLGSSSYTPLLTGSTLPIIGAGAIEQTGDSFGQDLLSMQVLSERFTEESYSDDTTSVGESIESFIEQDQARRRGQSSETLEANVPFREGKTPSFGERLIRLIVYLSSFNGVFRQMVVRTRLLAKLSALPDSSLESLIPLEIAQSLLGSSQNQVTARSSVLDIIRNVSGYAFYHFTQLPMPPRATVQPGDNKVFPSLNQSGSAEDEDQFKIGAEFYRNDILFLPDLYYALPPPCNLIFPDMIESFDIDRFFNVEPTRLVITDPFLSAMNQKYHFWLAPTSILRNIAEEDLAKLTAGEVFSLAAGYAKSSKLSSEQAGESAYAYPEKGIVSSTTVRSLLGVVQDSEFEKGIITSIANQGFEQFAASAFSRADTTTTDSESIKSEGNRDYREYMLELAKYRLQILKFQRSARVSLVGHRWIAPGFPVIIFDQSTSYLAQVQTSTTRIDPEGKETTDLQLTYARPVPKIDTGRLRSLLSSVSSALENAQDLPSIEMPSFGYAARLALEASSDLSSWLSSLRNGRLDELPPAASNTLSQIRNIARITSTTLDRDPDPTIELNDALLIYFGDDQIDRIRDIQLEISSVITIGKSLATATQNAGRLTPEQRVGGITHAYLQYLFTETRFVDEADERVANAVAILGSKFKPLSLIGDLQSVVRGGELSSIESEFSANSLGGVVAILEASLFFLNLAQSAVSAFLTSQATTLADRDFANYITPASFTGSEEVIDDLSGLNERAQAAVDLFESDYDWPAVPRFFNQDLLDPVSLDAIYQELLGCQPFYSDVEEVASLSDLSLIRGVSERLSSIRGLSSEHKLITYLNQLQGYVLLDSIFPILDSSDPSSIVPKAPSSNLTWKQVSEESGTGAGPFQWAHVNFLKRSATTLGDFLEDNNLELVQQYSNPPTVSAFWQMAPPVGSTTTVGDKVWDDSIFSKLVDDRNIRGLTPDPLLNEARLSVTATYLTTLERQTELLKYSTSHFGGRGFDGS